MTNRLKTSLAVALVAIGLAAAAPFVMAQDAQPRRGPGFGGPGMRGPGGPMAFGFGFRELDLSDDQRAQIKAIADSHQAEFKQVGEKIRAARGGMRSLLAADVLDEAAVRAKSVEVAAAEADIAILNAKVRAEAMQVLTSEQQKKLKELRASGQGGTRHRRPPAF